MDRFKNDLGYNAGEYIYAVVRAKNEKDFSISSNPNSPSV